MESKGNTQQEIRQFEQDGFIIFDKFLDQDISKNALLRFDPIFSGEFETGVLPDKIKWHKGKDSDRVPRIVANAWKSDKTIAKITLSEEIGQIAAQLMGWPGTRIIQDTMFWVPPGAGTVSFHQDDSYHDWHEPGGIITCWIALNDTNASGGTLEYNEGSHKWPLSPRINEFLASDDYRKELVVAAELAKEEINVVSVVVPTGGTTFHHGKMWHGSNYNYTDQSRYSISVHCMTSESTFHPKIPSPMFNHYKFFEDLKMDESFFPVLWTKDGGRSKFLDNYLK